MSGETFVQLIAILGAVLILILLSIVAALLIFYFTGMWKLYKKLGVEGWKSLIPIYRKWVLFEAVGLNWYWFIIYFVSLCLFIQGSDIKFISDNVILVDTLDTNYALGFIGLSLTSVACIYNLAKKFKQSKGWIALTFIFDIITLPLLGLSNSVDVDANATVTPNAMFDDNKKNQVVSKVKKVSKKIEKAVEDKKKVKKDK